MSKQSFAIVLFKKKYKANNIAQKQQILSIKAFKYVKGTLDLNFY